MDLNQRIEKYYFDKINDLPEDKRFHFASRLAAWRGEPTAYALLAQLKDYMMQPQDGLTTTIKYLLGSQPSRNINSFALRQEYFEKYPSLYGIHSALFRVRHLKFVYGIDAMPVLNQQVSQPALDQLADNIQADVQALRILSTYAINFLYLYKVILMGNKTFVDLPKIIKLKDGYDLKNFKHIQLLIYLYTHCIIGETNFYTREVETGRKSDCIMMLEILETIISENFDLINLDNKLEFLVCGRICGIKSELFERVYSECQTSISDEGHYLVDRHNKNAQEDRKNFAKSEHRNVLFIMSNSIYKPNSTLISS